VAGGRLRIDPAQPVVVGRGEPAVPPVHEAVDPEKDILPGARQEMVRGHGDPEQRGPLADRRAQFPVRGQEVVEAVARAHHEEFLVAPGEPFEVRDDALAFLVDVRRGELLPDGPLRAELFQVQAAHVNVRPDGAQEHGESETDLPGHSVDARDEVEGEGRVPVAVLGEVVVEEREALEGGQVLSLEQFGQHEASPRRTNRRPGRVRGLLGGRMHRLDPIPARLGPPPGSRQRPRRRCCRAARFPPKDRKFNRRSGSISAPATDRQREVDTGISRLIFPFAL
jgi:hypothetical protein